MRGVVRSESPPPRRGRRRGKRTWVTVDGAPAAGGPLRPATPGRAIRSPRPADRRAPGASPDRGRPGRPEPDTDRYQPRRRYPWHDDPHYDPAAHRATGPAAELDAAARRPARRRPAAPAAPPRGRTGRRTPRPPRPGPDRPHRRAAAGRAPPTRRPPPRPGRPGGMRMPRKLTVTRVAALRSRQLTAERDPRLPPRGQRRRRRPLRADRAHLRHDDDLRGGRGGRRRAGQHAVLRGRDRREQDQRGALPGHHGGPVRRGRAGDRPAAGPAAARPPGGAGRVLRRPRGARRGDGPQLRHLAALPGRAGHAGAVASRSSCSRRRSPRGCCRRRSRWSPRTPG